MADGNEIPITLLLAMVVGVALVGALLGVLFSSNKYFTIKTSEEGVMVKVSSVKDENACESACRTWYFAKFVFEDQFLKNVKKACGMKFDFSKAAIFCGFYLEGIDALNLGGDAEKAYLEKLEEYGVKINWDLVKEKYEKSSYLAREELRKELIRVIS